MDCLAMVSIDAKPLWKIRQGKSIRDQATIRAMARRIVALLTNQTLSDFVYGEFSL